MRRNMLWWQISNPTGESPDHLHLRSSKQQLHIFAPQNKIKQTKTSEADGLLFLKLFLSDARGRWDPQGTAMPAPTSQPVERGAPVPALQTSQGCGFCCPRTNGCPSLARCTVLYLKLARTEGMRCASDDAVSVGALPRPPKYPSLTRRPGCGCGGLSVNCSPAQPPFF